MTAYVHRLKYGGVAARIGPVSVMVGSVVFNGLGDPIARSFGVQVGAHDDHRATALAVRLHVDRRGRPGKPASWAPSWADEARR